MRTGGPWHRSPRLTGLTVTSLRIHRRTPRLRVEAGGPVGLREGLRGNELTRRAIEHVEITVLRRLHDDLAHLAIDGEIGEGHLLDGRVIPTFPGRVLEVPDILAGIGTDRDDRSGEQVIATAASRVIPGLTVVGAEVEQVELGIVGHAVPGGTAAPELPELTIPTRARLALEDVIGSSAVRFTRLAGNCVETPNLLSCRGVVSGDVPAGFVFAARVADDDFAFNDARSARNRVRLGIGVGTVGSRNRPDLFARRRIQRDEAPVERPDINPAVPDGDATIGDITAALDARGTGHCRIEHPQLLAGSRIEREHLAPRRGDVHDAVDDYRRRFLDAMRRVQVVVPCELQLTNISGVDLLQRTEALLVIRTPVGHPVTGLAVGRHEARGVHRRLAS